MFLLTIEYQEAHYQWHLFKDEQSAREKANKLIEAVRKTYNELENENEEEAWQEMYDAVSIHLARMVFNGKEYVPEQPFLMRVYIDEMKEE